MQRRYSCPTTNNIFLYSTKYMCLLSSLRVDLKESTFRSKKSRKGDKSVRSICLEWICRHGSLIKYYSPTLQQRTPYDGFALKSIVGTQNIRKYIQRNPYSVLIQHRGKFHQHIARPVHITVRRRINVSPPFIPKTSV